jgi:hypothetical protein
VLYQKAFELFASSIQNRGQRIGRANESESSFSGFIVKALSAAVAAAQTEHLNLNNLYVLAESPSGEERAQNAYHSDTLPVK